MNRRNTYEGAQRVMLVQSVTTPTHTHDLDAMIELCLAFVKPAATAKDLLLGWRTGCEGTRVLGRQERNTSVLAALLLDAIHHSPHRGVISLEVGVTDDRVDVAISDQRPSPTHGDGHTAVLVLERA